MIRDEQRVCFHVASEATQVQTSYRPALSTDCDMHMVRAAFCPGLVAAMLSSQTRDQATAEVELLFCQTSHTSVKTQ